MAVTADIAALQPPSLIDDAYGSGPVSRRLFWRALFVYVALCVAGLLPALLSAPTSWQVSGLGLLFPGAGFLGVGGWVDLLFPVTVLLMLIAAALMLFMGNAFAPLLVWFGSAVLAGSLARPVLAASSLYLIPGVMIGFVAFVMLYSRRTLRRELAHRALRNAYLPRAEQAVVARAAARPAPGTREMSRADLAHLRYALDRGLQPKESLQGFQIIEQFQTSALRYQINNLLWPLQIAQCHYTPNFHGYLSQAQRNLIDKLTLPKVWRYWRWENLWGNLSLNADPIAKDNIMFGAFSAAHVACYTANTGDRRYLEPGSLTFRLNRFRSYRHSLETILATGRENHRTASYGPSYPCEPKLTYSACNLIGNLSHLTADRIFGTNYRAEMLEPLRRSHVSEMMCRDGVVHAGRVVPLGIRIPLYTSSQVEALWAWMASPFFPDLSRRVWATLREEYVSFDAQGEIHLTLKSYDRMDLGNFRRSDAGPYVQFLVIAREQGDDEVAGAILRKFERDFDRLEREGVTSYGELSNYAMGLLIMGQLIRTGDIRAMVNDGPPAGALSGPVLTSAPYPDVLVAKAYSDGTALELVLYPGAEASRQSLRIERLQPGRRYALTGAGGAPAQLESDAAGCAAFEVDLAGRTEIRLAPV